MLNTILAKRVNHIVAKGDNPAWPKGSKSRGFSSWESDTMTEDEITGHVTNAYKTEKDNFGTVEFTFYK